jgi:F0F1-type ATP synthase membrane subunit b/b'
VAFGMLSQAVVVLAAGHGEEHAPPAVSDLLFPAINFLIFLYILRRAGGGAIRDYLQGRRAEIVSALDGAAAAEREAKRLHDEARARIAQVTEETTRLRADLRAAAAADLERRRTLATAAAKRITANAHTVADQEGRTALRRLREETVAAAVAETVTMLRRQIKASDQERFVTEFAGGLRAQG